MSGAPRSPASGGDRIRWLGHATALVELRGTRLLTDPVLRGRVAHIRRRVPLPSTDGLSGLDAVLVSHAHFDHLDLPSLSSLAASAPIVAPRGCGRLLRRHLSADIVEVEAGDRVCVGSVEVIATPAAHDGRRHPLGRPMPALGFVIEGGSRVYFAGDTDLFDGMRRLAAGLDIALLPVSGWGRRLPSGHLDPQRAARATRLLRPRLAVPIHWGTLAAPGAWPADPERPAREFARLAAAYAPSVEVRILCPGDSLPLA